MLPAMSRFIISFISWSPRIVCSYWKPFTMVVYHCILLYIVQGYHLDFAPTHEYIILLFTLFCFLTADLNLEITNTITFSFNHFVFLWLIWVSVHFLLQPLCRSDPMLVLESSLYVLECNPSETIELFLSENVPADLVNSYLKQHAPNLQSTYLELMLSMSEIGINPNLQNELVCNSFLFLFEELSCTRSVVCLYVSMCNHFIWCCLDDFISVN